MEHIFKQFLYFLSFFFFFPQSRVIPKNDPNVSIFAFFHLLTILQYSSQIGLNRHYSHAG